MQSLHSILYAHMACAIMHHFCVLPFMKVTGCREMNISQYKLLALHTSLFDIDRHRPMYLQ